MGSWPKSLLQRAGRPSLLRSRSNPKSKHARPPSLRSSTFWPSSSVPSGGLCHRTLLWGVAPGIWMASLFPVAYNTPGMKFLHLPVTTPLPAANFSGLRPARRGKWWGGGGWVTPTANKCYSQGSGGGGGYLTPESLLCAACGSEWSAYRGWYASSPTPFSPSLVTLLFVLIVNIHFRDFC